LHPLLRHRLALATSLCALLFFLGTADSVFALRAYGINLRFANLLLAVGLVVWVWKRRREALEDLGVLSIGWMPFVAAFGLAVALSDAPWLGLLKLGWFAFNFVAAFAWCRLFPRDAVVRGYFAAFLFISLLIGVDFASGFVHGDRYMIGLGQPNDLAAGEILWRPHAFYYEPSYAASGVALAWALAMTTMGAVAPRIAPLLIVSGAVALTVIMSRTGWIYAIVVLGVLGVYRLLGRKRATGIRWSAMLALAGVATLAAGLLLSEQTRTRFTMLSDALGWHRTFERICPLVRDNLDLPTLRCATSAAALRSVGVEVAEESSEGQRIVNAQHAIASIEARPLVGHGVTPGHDRLLEPTAKNTWLEIAVEGGVLSAAALAWGLLFTLKRFGAFEAGNRAIAIVLLLYFVVAWQFLQTFPRLDQWLSVWVALTFLASGRAAKPAASEDAEHDLPALAHGHA
jgi:O-Antigen ligase